MFMSGVSTIMYDTKALADAQAPLYVVIAIVLALIVLMFTLKSYVLPLVLLMALCTAVVYNMGTNIFFRANIIYYTVYSGYTAARRYHGLLGIPYGPLRRGTQA